MCLYEYECVSYSEYVRVWVLELARTRLHIHKLVYVCMHIIVHMRIHISVHIPVRVRVCAYSDERSQVNDQR